MHLKKLRGLFAGKIDKQILRQTLKQYRWVCVAGVGAALALSLLAAHSLQPVRYELETAGSEIDFAGEEIAVHTAADGIAIVRPKSREAVPPEGASTIPSGTAEPVRVAVPADPWENDATPTHGGFTLPVQMDDTSIGILSIPDLGLSVRVYESENEMEDMDRGVAHFKSTSAFEGNVGLSAHNINFDGSAGYFRDLYTLKKGAIIQYETAVGTREYKVESVTEIAETDWSRLGRTEDNRITLITCITGKPDKRLCIQALETRS